jgi:hypothetical protein
LSTFLVSDTGALSDSLGLNLATLILDSLSLSDRLVVSTIFPSERLVLSDSVAISYIRPGLSVQDQVAFNDSLATSLTRVLSVSDTLSFSDSTSSPLAWLVPPDALSLSDAAVATLSVLPGISLTQYVTDTYPQFRDNLSLSASPSLLLYTNSVRLSDEVNVSLQSSDTAYFRRYLNDV